MRRWRWTFHELVPAVALPPPYIKPELAAGDEVVDDSDQLIGHIRAQEDSGILKFVSVAPAPPEP